MMNFAQIGIFSRAQFTPLALPGLAGWYDADDASTITIGTGVSQWNDKSGNSRHAVQATGTKQPSIATGVQNGKNALQFDGSNDDLVLGALADWTFLHSDRATVYIVAKIGDSSNPDALYSLLGNAGGTTSNVGYHLAYDDRASVPNNNALLLQTYKGTLGTPTHVQTVPSFLNPNTFLSLTAISRMAAGNNSSGVGVNNDSLVTEGSFASPSSSNPTYTLKLGQHGNNGGFLKGYVAELLIYNTQHTSVERERVVNYLNQKWAIF